MTERLGGICLLIVFEMGSCTAVQVSFELVSSRGFPALSFQVDGTPEMCQRSQLVVTLRLNS